MYDPFDRPPTEPVPSDDSDSGFRQALCFSRWRGLEL